MERRSINIFISSTFNDMQAERDYIRKFVVPRLKEQFAEHQVYIQVTDLRWGVDTRSVDEHEREAKVLHVCLDAIQNSRPYFVALLGDRYGWVPSAARMDDIRRMLPDDRRPALGEANESMSVTEMEILLGAIGERSLLPHSFFCFRNRDSYQGMSDAELRQFVDETSDSPDAQQGARRLSRLKARIEQECDKAGMADNIIRYTARWNVAEHHFEQLQAMGDELYNLISADISKELALGDRETGHDEEAARLAAFVAAHVEDFQGRRQMLDRFVKFFLDARDLSSVLNGARGIFLTGFSGCGKSSLFCMLYDHLKRLASTHSFYILAHAAGVTPKSVRAEQMLAQWCEQMGRDLNDETDDTDDEDNYGYAKKLIRRFKLLVARLQARGLMPVVLIDSLDSFEPSDILRDFDFLPFDVPFLCTTLPGHADKIMAQHPNFRQYDMDAFTRDDAVQVIHHTLRKNFKELPDAQQEQLLAITADNGRPAYESPLWLRMTLDILMELGADDFNEIHRIGQLEEDEKIEHYLGRIISQLPTNVEALFRYFIDLTCRYFNPALTQQTLAYIAIAQYGVREDDLAALLAEQWNPLDFVSLRYWMRDFIQCNNKDHRWFFTHVILRKTMREYDAALYKQCEDRFFRYLVDHLSTDDDEIKELIHQLILRRDHALLHDNDNKLHYPFCNAFADEYNLHPDDALDFMQGFISRYLVDGAELVDDLTRSLLDKGEITEEQKFIKAALTLADYHVAQFTDDVLHSGMEAVEAFFTGQCGKGAHLYYENDPKVYVAFFNSLRKVYDAMKAHYGEQVLTYSRSYNFFSPWHDAIRKLRRLSMHDEQWHKPYCQCIADYIDEWARWCHRYGAHKFLEKAQNAIEQKYELSTDEQISFMQQMQMRIAELIAATDQDDPDFNDTVADACQLITQYVNLFDSDDVVVVTPLMEALDYRPEQNRPDPAAPATDSFSQFLDNGPNDENTVSISFTNTPPEDDDEEGEWVTIGADDMDPDSLARKLGHAMEDDEVDDSEYEMPEPATADEIAEAERELDDLLKAEAVIDKQTEDEAHDMLREKSRLYRRLALMYLSAGNEERGNNLMHQLGHVLVECIIDMGSNYALGDHDTDGIISHGNWLARIGQTDEQLRQAEAVTGALLHSYYHHQNGDAQRRMYNYLLNLYERQGMADERIALLSRMYEIGLRTHVERIFDAYDIFYNDLSYVRPIFLNLYKALKAEHRIREAVVALERWVDLCHRVYIDEEDSSGYDDLDRAYDMLAELYDGTPALVEGMRERQSVFLRDHLIMVSHDSGWGYINHDGQVVVPLVYSRVWKAEPECLSVCRDGQWGYLDANGQELAAFESLNFNLDVAVPIRNGWGRIAKNDNWAMFTYDGFYPIRRECYDFHGITDGLTKVTVEVGGQYRQDFLLTDGETLLFGGTKHSVKTPNQGVIVADCYIPDEDEGHRAGIYDVQGHELTTPGRYMSIAPFGQEQLAPARTTDYRAGYLNRAGQEAIPFVYKHCRPFACGRGAVCKEGIYEWGHWGFVDEKGREVVAPQYIDVGDFHEGLAWVCLDNGTSKGFGFRGGKFGFINTQGEMVIPAVYDDVSSFYEGRALVWQRGRAFYINSHGETTE